MSSPFDFAETTSFLPLVQQTPVGTTGGPPVSAASGAASGGGLLGSITGVLTSVLNEVSKDPIGLATQLAKAGVIRGTVGEALAGQQQMMPTGTTSGPTTGGVGQTKLNMAIAQQVAAVRESGLPGSQNFGAQELQVAAQMAASAGITLGEAITIILANIAGEVIATSDMFSNRATGGDAMDEDEGVIDAILNMVGFGDNGEMQVGGGVAQCPTLFRQRRQGTYLPSRIQVKGPDGQIYVLANLGRATRGSRETSVLKRLAKDNGFVAKRRTSPR